MAQQSVRVRTAKQAAIETTIGASPKLCLFGGAAMPANCAAADAGTLGSKATLPADWAAQANGAMSKVGTWAGVATVAFLARYFRIKDNAEANVDWQGLVSEPYAASKPYLAGMHVHNGTHVYLSTNAGTSGAASPPTGTGAGIVDNDITWDYVGEVDMIIDNTSLNLNQNWSVSAFDNTDANG